MKTIVKWISACLAGIFAVVLVVIVAMRSSLLIYFGIRNYTTLRNVMLGLLIVSIVVTVSCFIRNSKKKEVTSETAFVSDNQLSPDEHKSVLHNLEKLGYGKWITLKGDIFRIREQLTTLEGLVKGLDQSTVYKKDSSLDDTDDLVYRLVDCAYRNVQKLVDYMIVMPNSDTEFILQKVTECYNCNATYVDKSKEFVKAVVEYAYSTTGDEEAKSIALIQSYKETVLETLDDESMHLS